MSGRATPERGERGGGGDLVALARDGACEVKEGTGRCGWRRVESGEI